MVNLRVIRRYKDVELNRDMNKGEALEVTEERAIKLLDLGLAEVLKISKIIKKKNERKTKDVPEKRG